MESNFITRGRTKESVFVKGYYLPIRDKHYICKIEDCKKINLDSINPFENLTEINSILIVDKLFHDEVNTSLNCTEIIAPPDRCLGIKDIEGKDVFENDNFYVNGVVYKVTYDKDDGCFMLVSDEYKRYLNTDTVKNYGLKIIGNTYNIK